MPIHARMRKKKRSPCFFWQKENPKTQHAPRTDPNICRARSGAHAEFDERERVSVQNGNRIRSWQTGRQIDRIAASQHGNPKDPLPMHGTASSRRYAYSQGDCVSRSDGRLLRRRHGCWEITARIASFLFSFACMSHAHQWRRSK
jgi:hypothetical protein